MENNKNIDFVKKFENVSLFKNIDMNVEQLNKKIINLFEIYYRILNEDENLNLDDILDLLKN